MTGAQDVRTVCPHCGMQTALMLAGGEMSESYYSDEALAKQAALEALPEGTRAPWSMLLGICEPRVKATDAERCNCCGLDARDDEGGEEHDGKRWCFICIGRGHHEERR